MPARTRQLSVARRIDSQQPLQSPLQILRANQERLGFFFARFDQQTAAAAEGRENALPPAPIKFKYTVRFSTRSGYYGAARIQKPGGNDEAAEISLVPSYISVMRALTVVALYGYSGCTVAP